MTFPKKCRGLFLRSGWVLLIKKWVAGWRWGRWWRSLGCWHLGGMCPRWCRACRFCHRWQTKSIAPYVIVFGSMIYELPYVSPYCSSICICRYHTSSWSIVHEYIITMHEYLVSVSYVIYISWRLFVTIAESMGLRWWILRGVVLAVGRWWAMRLR